MTWRARVNLPCVALLLRRRLRLDSRHALVFQQHHRLLFVVPGLLGLPPQVLDLLLRGLPARGPLRTITRPTSHGRTESARVCEHSTGRLVVLQLGFECLFSVTRLPCLVLAHGLPRVVVRALHVAGPLVAVLALRPQAQVALRARGPGPRRCCQEHVIGCHSTQ